MLYYYQTLPIGFVGLLWFHALWDSCPSTLKDLLPSAGDLPNDVCVQNFAQAHHPPCPLELL